MALLAALPYLAGGVSPNFIALDDPNYISENLQVRRGLTPQTALWALTSIEDANWYPLRRLSHLADVSLFGLDARGHHLVSVVWHAAAALLLFLALHRMTGMLWRSFIVAGLFAAHPLQVESVAWASERSNVQAGFFLALTLLLWVRYARRPSRGRYAAVLCCCALGLVAKPVLVTLPFVLLLLDLWPLGRVNPPGAPPWRVSAALLGSRLLEKAPLLLFAAASGGMAVFAHRQSGALQTLEAIPLEARLANAALSYWRYLGKILWPADLVVFYPHPGKDLPLGPALAAGLLLAAATALALLSARRRPWLAAGWLWYAGMLVPMSGIVQFGVHAMADRFVYLPSIGVFLALVWLLAEGLPAPLRRPAVLGPAAIAALGALAVATAVQAKYWRDSEALFSRTIAVTSRNWKTRDGREAVPAEQGREQVVAFMENMTGTVLAARGRHEEAVAHYSEALRFKPDFAEARYNLGRSLAALGRHREAVARFRETLVAWPGLPEVRVNLGTSLAYLGLREEAVASYRDAIRIEPGRPEAWHNLGVVLANLGRSEEAAASLREALRLRPDYPAARARLGEILAKGTTP